MPDVSDFPITQRWPAKRPDRLQLYSLPTPNGVKVSIMLEEIGLPYEVHRIDFDKGEQRTPEFLSLNPNGKIPAILDPDGPDGEPLPLFESGAILQYLAERTGKLLPATRLAVTRRSSGCIFRWAGSDRCSVRSASLTNSPAGNMRTSDRFSVTSPSSKRLLGVMEAHLAGRQWIMDDEYTIADISMLGWVRNLIGFYEARELVEFDSLREVPAWLERGLARPAVQRGLNIPPRP